MTLVDRSAGMLAVSQRLNPECEHVLGDMRTVRLNRLFDAVLIHDAIMYMLSLADLLQALDIELTLRQELTLLAVAMLTSKGASGVTGAGFVTLAVSGTTMTTSHLPLVLGLCRRTKSPNVSRVQLPGRRNVAATVAPPTSRT